VSQDDPITAHEPHSGDHFGERECDHPLAESFDTDGAPHDDLQKERAGVTERAAGKEDD
jgi:hypothetical protein